MAPWLCDYSQYDNLLIFGVKYFIILQIVLIYICDVELVN
jgi:hypothetical protein